MTNLNPVTKKTGLTHISEFVVQLALAIKYAQTSPSQASLLFPKDRQRNTPRAELTLRFHLTRTWITQLQTLTSPPSYTSLLKLTLSKQTSLRLFCSRGVKESKAAETRKQNLLQLENSQMEQTVYLLTVRTGVGV